MTAGFWAHTPFVQAKERSPGGVFWKVRPPVVSPMTAGFWALLFGPWADKPSTAREAPAWMGLVAGWANVALSRPDGF